MLCVALAALAIAVAYSLEFSCNANYKRAPRLWLGDEIRATALMREASRIELNDKQCHYVTTVLRLRKGDVVRAFGARLGEYASTLHIDYEGRRRKASLAPFIETRAPIHRAENVLINKVTGAPADLQSPIEVYFAPLRTYSFCSSFESVNRQEADGATRGESGRVRNTFPPYMFTSAWTGSVQHACDR